MIDLLFGLLLAFHSAHVGPSYRNEPEDERLVRLHDIAQADVEACKAHPLWYQKGKKKIEWPLEGCVGWLATAQEWESGLLVEVHSGARRGKAGEIGLSQLDRHIVLIPDRRWAISRQEWTKVGGTDLEATRRSAELTVRVAGWHVYRCGIQYKGGARGQIARLFAEYHHPSAWPCSVGDEPDPIVRLPSDAQWNGIAYGLAHRATGVAKHVSSGATTDKMAWARADSFLRLVRKLSPG